MSSNPKAFVLMPFDPEFRSIFEELILPALESVGYTVTRADSFDDQQNILRDIVEGIATADLVIADLTTLNPNVMYELGLCHGLGIPTVMLTQSVQTIPFDLRSYRMIPYSTHFDQVKKLKSDLAGIGERQRNGTLKSSSPVRDFLPKPSLSSQNNLASTRSDRSTNAALDEEQGYIDLLHEGTRAIVEMAEILSEVTGQTQKLAQKLNEHTSTINSLKANPTLDTASQIYDLTLSVAGDMNRFSKRLESELPTLEKDIDIFTNNFLNVMNVAQLQSEEDRKALGQFRQTVSDLLTASRSGKEGTRTFRNSVETLAQMGVSKEINRASRRMMQSQDSIIAGIERVEAFCARTLLLIDEMLKRDSDLDFGART